MNDVHYKRALEMSKKCDEFPKELEKSMSHFGGSAIMYAPELQDVLFSGLADISDAIEMWKEQITDYYSSLKYYVDTDSVR